MSNSSHVYRKVENPNKNIMNCVDLLAQTPFLVKLTTPLQNNIT